MRLLASSLFIFFILSHSLQAQQESPANSSRFGFLAVDRVLVLMPEMDGVRSELSDYEGQLLSQLKVKMDVFQTKLYEYQSLAENLPETTKLERQKELESADADIQKFRADAQQAVAEKEAKLMQPVYQKIQTAIEEVAKANGLTQIFRAETLLYNDNAIDIFDLMVKHLELKLPANAENGN